MQFVCFVNHSLFTGGERNNITHLVTLCAAHRSHVRNDHRPLIKTFKLHEYTIYELIIKYMYTKQD